MNSQIEVYKDIYSNYKSCQIEKEYLSDTWDHTLTEKGHMFTLSELLEMRAPGNRVNSWMVDSLYAIDDTAIDLNDSIVVALLELGESNVGYPRKDICVGGQFFSSLFLRDVNNAAFLIGLIEQSGFNRPRVLEIGGGIGLLMYLLKQYFKEKITIFAVDLPETLLIQEQYLRQCFPDMPHCYKSTDEPVDFTDGGINFINAYVLKHQNIQFDIAVNFDSMQEMNKPTVDAYINYIESNISLNSFFLFQNRYGHSTNCVPEPSEYEFDTNWKVEIAEMTNPFSNCNEVEELRLLLRRTAEKEDTDTRRLVLRTIWNGYNCGLLQNGDTIIQELLSVPSQVRYVNSLTCIKQIFEKNNIESDFISSLEYSLYFPPGFFTSNTLLELLTKSASADYTITPREFVRMAELRYCQELIKASEDASISRIKGQLNKICQSCSEFANRQLPSDFWSSNLAGILYSLGDSSNGTNLLNNSLCRSKHPRWVLRAAILFQRYNLIQESDIVLECLRKVKPINDPIIKLKQIELEYFSGNIDYARRKLEVLVAERDLQSVTAIELAKTAVATNAIDVLKMILLSDKGVFTISHGKAFFNLLSRLGARPISKELSDFIHGYCEDAFKRDDSNRTKIDRGIVFLYLGMEDLGLSIIENEINWHSYFDLARIGRLLLELGHDETADTYVQESVRIRPGNFMHQVFIGDAYFSCGRFDEAAEFFRTALAVKPYVRPLEAKIAYCGLSKDLHRDRIFGEFSDLQNYFSLSQSFYQDSPDWK